MTAPEVELPDFDLPRALEASTPPRRRDGVRLLVARPTGLRHRRFPELADELTAGDLVVVNTSSTLAAALDGRRSDGRVVTVHLSTPLEPGRWLVEVRPRRRAAGPITDAVTGEAISLPEGVVLRLRHRRDSDQPRLWVAELAVEGGVEAYLRRVGRPIRYRYVPRRHPMSAYQTVFGRQPGSAEMASAGRPFTDRLVTELVTRGVTLAPVTLHTGVSSQEGGEPPLPERMQVSAATARLVAHTRDNGGRVVAVGTTVTRALESAVAADGSMRAHTGWTDLVLGPERPARVVTGLITGWHAPGASHLRLLQAVAGSGLVEQAYAEARRERYRWHEFGDSCLLLP